jgi:hypothetical protein
VTAALALAAIDTRTPFESDRHLTLSAIRSIAAEPSGSAVLDAVV